MSAEQVMTGLVEPHGRGEEPLYHFTRVYLLFLQGLFEQFPDGSYKWSDDQKLSQIAITDQAPIPRERVEQTPTIITMRGPAQFANLTLDQMRQVDSKTGSKERTDLVACTMSLNCIAKQGVEAQRIAWIVMRHLRTFKVLLQRAGIHKVGDELSMGPESPPGSLVAGDGGDAEAVLVTVQSPFFFQWTELVTPLDAPQVASIEARLLSAVLPAAAANTAGSQEYRLNQPTIRGRVIQSRVSGHQRVGEITQTVKT